MGKEKLINFAPVIEMRPTKGAKRGWKKASEQKGEYQSGQMGQTVNLLVYTFGGSNPSSPTNWPKGDAEVAQLVEH